MTKNALKQKLANELAVSKRLCVISRTLLTSDDLDLNLDL